MSRFAIFVLAVLLGVTWCAKHSHAQQQPVLCVTGSSTACNSTSNPGNGTQGDPYWKAFGKVNANLSQLYSMFGTSAHLYTTGSTIATDITGLFGSCSGSAVFLINAGTCLSITGDVTVTSGGVATVGKINGATVPTSAAVIGTNGSGQPVALSLGGNLISVSGVLGTQTNISTITTSTYTVAASDSGKLLQLNSASEIAISLPQAGTTGFGANVFSFDVQNIGSAAATITPTTSTINGWASLTIPPSSFCSITSDGTNYRVSACTALNQFVNVCSQTTPCYPDTLYARETLTCQGVSGAGTTAVVSNMAETLPAYYIGAPASVTGCGPLQANAVVDGISPTANGSGYSASPLPIAGDYIVVAGGTQVAGPTITGSISSTGVLTATAVSGGTIGSGMLLSGAGIPNGVFVIDYGVGTTGGGVGTYTTTYSGTAIGSETITGSNPTILRVLTLAGPISTVTAPAGTGTAGGPYTNISLTGGNGSGAIGTVTMGGSGGTHVTGVTITTPGSNYTQGDILSCNGIPGGTNCSITVASVNTSSGAVGQVGIAAGGLYTSPPGSLVSGTTYSVIQGSTSGSGTGATFNLTYAGTTISGTVGSIAANSFTFASGTNAITPYTSKANEKVSVGHDNSAAYAAAKAQGSVVIFPPTLKPSWASVPLSYGFTSQNALVNTNVAGVFCNGANLVANAPMNVMFQATYLSGVTQFQSLMDNCHLQAMGVANFGLYHSIAHWVYRNSSIEDALVDGMYIGDAVGNAQDNLLSGMTITSNSTAVPQWAAYGLEVNGASDNKMAATNINNFRWSPVYSGGADLQMDDTSHFFAVSVGPGVDVESAKAGIAAIVDHPAPGQACYFLNGSLVNMKDGAMCSLENVPIYGRYGIYINQDNHNNIGCFTGANNAPWSVAPSQLVYAPGGLDNLTYTQFSPCSGGGYQYMPGRFSSIRDSGITGLTQCVHVDTNGNFTGTGQDCGTGSFTNTYTYTGTGNFSVNDTNGVLFKAIDPGATSNNYVALLPAATGTAAQITVQNASTTTSTDLSLSISAKNAPTSSALAGGNSSLNGGNGDGAAAGGNSNLNGGNGGATGKGGSINIVGGPGGSTSGNGGDVAIKGGAFTSGTQGIVNISVAATSATNISTGASTGAVNIDNGTGTGNVNIGNSADQINLTASAINTNSLAWNNISRTTATTTGYGFLGSGAPVFTDSSGTGSVTSRYEFKLPAVTSASSTAATTYTNDYGLFVPAPTAGTNVTITNAYSYGGDGGMNISGTTQINQNSASNTGIGTGNTANAVTVGNNTAGSTVAIPGATTTLGCASGGCIVNINTGAATGAVHIADGTGTSIVTVGNSANTVNLSPGTLKFGAITGSTQCLQASSTGVVTGTGSACGSGGSTAFSGLTSGTNTTAAMLVGTGASLGPTGSGTINANQVNGASVPTSATVAATNGSGQIVSATSQAIMSGYTVSGLPTCNSGSKGLIEYVTDASSPTFLATLTGGASTVTPAFCNGTNWVAF